MAVLERDDVERSLLRKGFEKVDGDHHVFWLVVDGKLTDIHTKTSHGSSKYKTLGHPLVKAMADQLELTIPEFKQLVQCTMSGDDYLAHLRATNKLEP